MRATALACDENQRFTLEDVDLRDPGAEDVAVRTIVSGVSIGTESSLIRGRISWGPYPLCTGYQGVGVVDHVGENVEGFSLGQKVFYRHNRDMRLADGRDISAVSGVHCSMAVVDPRGAQSIASLPDGVDDDSASLFVMPAVALLGVDRSQPLVGDVVVVHGCGLIGLGVVAACATRGCRVVAVDLRAARLEIAAKLGAEHTLAGDGEAILRQLHEIAPDGADVVFECTGLPQCIDPAIQLSRRLGKFVLQGNYGSAPISYQFLPPHGKQLTMYYPCDDGGEPFRRAVLRNMASGALPWHHTITHRIPFAQAPALFEAINTGEADDVTGAVIRWS